MKPTSEKGFTTVELIASMLIISLISLVLLNMLFASQVVWHNSFTGVKLHDSVKQPMQYMIRELKEADSSSPIGITTSTPGAITFAIPLTTSSSAITSWKQISYAWNSATGQITRTASGVSSIIGRNINSLTFSQSGSIITVSLGGSITAANNRVLTTSLVTQAAMRK